jgi:protein-disulfide reductase (glutathione)
MTRLLIAAMAVALSLAPAHAGGDWNDKAVGWQAYDAGLARAKQEKKPVMLVIYTEWCPHCTNYSKLFHDPAVIEKSRQFVMIRVDKDKQPEISKSNAPDGEYIPRTYFLSSNGVLDPALAAQRDRYRYFYNESDPKDVLAAMDSALAKLAAKPAAASK